MKKKKSPLPKDGSAARQNEHSYEVYHKERKMARMDIEKSIGNVAGMER